MSKIIKQILFLLFVFLFFFTTLTCKRSPIEPNGSEMLWLEFEDASCTEAWFNLRLNNLPKPVRVDVYRENYLTKSFTISATNDTLFYIENLLPKQKYDVYVKVRGSDGKEYTSTKVNFETLDTTSHEFSWQIFEFGEKGNSVLYDVAIIDENNIWAVGEIYTKDTYTYDSLGNWIQPYNAVHWDGTKWELKRIYTYSSCSSVDYAPLKAIYAFSHNKIVVTSGGGMWWFNGNNWNAECSINPLLTGAINKLWGSSSSDLYAVGNNGNIAHWDGRKWTKIESGTTLNINDIWGDYNEKTGQWEILAVCGNILHGQESEREILKVEKSKVQKINSTGSKWPLSSVWYKTERHYYVVGSGIYENKGLGINWSGGGYDITTYFVRRIRANSLNDVIIVGAFGEVLHYNGYSWKSFIDQTYLPLGTYLSVDVKGNKIVAVGWDSRQAIIITGKK